MSSGCEAEREQDIPVRQISSLLLSGLLIGTTLRTVHAADAMSATDRSFVAMVS